MIDVKNYIKRKINEYDNEIDISEGSVVSDFLINPLSSILAPYHSQHTEILRQLSLTDIDSMPEQTLDAIALTYLVERQEGAKASGEVWLYFDEAKAVTIPEGTLFETANGLIYESVRHFTVTRAYMQSNSLEYPYYVAGPIQVFATQAGEVFNVEENTTFKLRASLRGTPINILNKSAFSAGSDRETNTQLYNRIKRSIYGGSLASPSAIISTVQNYSEDILGVEVVGARNPLMIRDVMYDYTDVTEFAEETFEYVYSGQQSGEFSKKHIAYTGSFMDIDQTEDVAIREPGAFIAEFSNPSYQGLYRKDDLVYAEQYSNVHIREFWEPPSQFQNDLALVLASGSWELHDGIHPDNTLFYLDEIRMVNGQLILGKTKAITGNPDDPSSVTVPIPLAEINGQKALLEEAIRTGSTKKIQNLTTFYNFYTEQENINNVSPIIHREMVDHLGIEVSLSMSTTDGTERGETCYITALRNSKVHSPHDGYGLAWRKQPAYLYRMAYNTYGSDTALKQADLERFYEEYSERGDDLIGTDEILTNPDYWKFNVFLVDNDILQEEVWVGHEQIWDQTSGRNQFLQAAKVWIEPNIEYNFKFKINEYMGTQGWVWPSNESFDEVNHLVIDRGTSWPNYVPQSGDKKLVGVGSVVETLNPGKNHFGIGVGETRNYEWYVNDLNVKSIIETFGQHLFRFKIDPAKFDIYQGLWGYYYGVGYDPTQTVSDPTGDHAKTKVGVWNVPNEEWEVLGSGYHTVNMPVDTPLDIDLTLISGQISPLINYIDSEGYLNIGATAANSGPLYPNDTEHALRSYYVKLDSGQLQGVHRGNAADIYCHAPSQISLGSAVGAIAGNSLKTKGMTGIDPYIQEILEIRDYISQVQYDPSTYRINILNKGTVYSDEAEYEILFDIDNIDGALVEVVYRYWTLGDTVNNLIVNSENRYPTSDYMVKVMPPTVLTITSLEYSGGLSLDDMKTAFTNWVNTYPFVTFSKADIVQVLYGNGATFINLDMGIQLREYSTEGKIRTVDMTDVQSYTMPDTIISRFFTAKSELYGLTQV